MMSGFASRWMEWESSETPVQRTDKTDRRGEKKDEGAFVGKVGSTNRRLGLKTPPGKDEPSPSKTLTHQAAKTDKRLLGSNAGARGGVWDAETARLIEWFMRTPPPAKPFELCKGVVIANPALWWASLRQDIADGADGPRARHGAVQADLRRLAAARRRGRGHGH